MTDKKFTNSQSPRASRSSTNDPEKFAKNFGSIDQRDTERSGGAENESAWKHQSRDFDSDGKYA